MHAELELARAKVEVRIDSLICADARVQSSKQHSASTGPVPILILDMSLVPCCMSLNIEKTQVDWQELLENI